MLRRLSQLETRLGARLFDKLPSGYRLTTAGEEVVEFAEQMASASNRLETRVFGRDQGVGGLLRVTMTPMLASHLLMPDFAEFARLHADIEIDIVSSDAPANLTNREADVAIRVVYEQNALPLNLYGLKGPELFGGNLHVGRPARRLPLARGSAGALDPKGVRWHSGLGARGQIPIGEVPFKTSDAGAHIAALWEGLGMSALPYFIGDTDPLLVRAPGAGVRLHGSLWLLTVAASRSGKRSTTRCAGSSPGGGVISTPHCCCFLCCSNEARRAGQRAGARCSGNVMKDGTGRACRAHFPHADRGQARLDQPHAPRVVIAVAAAAGAPTTLALIVAGVLVGLQLR